VRRLLELSDLTVGYYKDIPVLQNINLKVKERDIICILGPNGAGKTTLLYTIAGFLKPFKGRILFNGKEISKFPPDERARMGLAYVMQRRALIPNLTVEQNLRLGAWHIKKDKERVLEKLEEIYGMFPDLKKKRHSLAGTLSGGQARMLEVARALMSEPKILLVDEPSFGLAPILVDKLFEKFEEIRRKGVTIILVEQNVMKGLKVSDYVYVMRMGKIVNEGSKEYFIENLHEMIKEYLTA
jgi:branched-chain amino acid transport system ATP-binding protein